MGLRGRRRISRVGGLHLVLPSTHDPLADNQGTLDERTGCSPPQTPVPLYRLETRASVIDTRALMTTRAYQGRYVSSGPV